MALRFRKDKEEGVRDWAPPYYPSALAHANSTPDTPHSAAAGGGHKKEAAHDVQRTEAHSISNTPPHTPNLD